MMITINIKWIIYFIKTNKITIPNMNKSVHVVESEVIVITEKEYNTILNGKKSKVNSINDAFTHLILNQRVLPPT
jgi:formylmethanofuran dehydrogenase subunit E-like metal-binding protein